MKDVGKYWFSELIVIFIIALIIFGAGKLPEIGKALGNSIKEFKKAVKEGGIDKEDNDKKLDKWKIMNESLHLLII